MKWWWLSFCDGSLPEGTQFLGAAVVDGETFADAIIRAHRLGCNPGGEVMFVEIPEDALPAPSYRHRLLDRATAERCGPVDSTAG